MTHPLEIRDLCKNFGGLNVTQNVSLSLPQGARHALIGPNGAGKSTLINLMTGVLSPSKGSIVLDGTDITTTGPAARVRLGLSRTFQVSTVFPELTPFEAVLLSVCARSGKSGDGIGSLRRREMEGEEALSVLTLLNLHHVADRPTRQLAYGQQRLLEIALALASRPSVLLLDEPAAGVPRSESEAVFSAIRGLPDNVSVLFIEHDMELVFRFAEHIHVLVTGRIFRSGTPAEIEADPAVRDVYLGREEED